MTNERFTETTTITHDDETFIIQPLPLDDRACLRLMLELQRDAAQYLLTNANDDLDGRFGIDARIPLTQFDYSGDHDDYNPAAASLLSLTTETLCLHEHRTARAALIALIETEDFLIAAMTADFASPLLALITDPDLD
jgi:hypothetical protein